MKISLQAFICFISDFFSIQSIEMYVKSVHIIMMHPLRFKKCHSINWFSLFKYSIPNMSSKTTKPNLKLEFRQAFLYYIEDIFSIVFQFDLFNHFTNSKFLLKFRWALTKRRYFESETRNKYFLKIVYPKIWSEIMPVWTQIFHISITF